MSGDAKDDGKAGGFTVTDRRIFADEQGAETPPSEKGASPAAGAGAALPVDFHTFVLSLGSSALMHLGELERPGGATVEKDLTLAKHTIDILAMLQQKTRGNLTPGEDKLIESLLFDLRLRFVEAKK